MYTGDDSRRFIRMGIPFDGDDRVPITYHQRLDGTTLFRRTDLLQRTGSRPLEVFTDRLYRLRGDIGFIYRRVQDTVPCVIYAFRIQGAIL